MSINFSNEEVVCAVDDAINELENVKDDLLCIAEFDDIYKEINDIIDDLKSRKVPYEEEWKKEQELEIKELNRQYEISRV